MSNYGQVIRVQKNKENPYVVMNKTFLSDERLTWKAKGILSYLLSKPDNWKVIVNDIVKNGEDGERAVYSALKELKQFGHLEKYAVRINNKIHHWESVVYETPQNVKLDEKEPEPIENTLLGCFVDVGNEDVQNRERKYNDFNNNDLNKELILSFNDEGKKEFSPSDNENKKNPTSAKVELNKEELYKTIANNINYEANINEHLIDSIIDNMVRVYNTENDYIKKRVLSYTEKEILWLSNDLNTCDIENVKQYVYTRIINLKSDYQISQKKESKKQNGNKNEVPQHLNFDQHKYTEDQWKEMQNKLFNIRKNKLKSNKE